MRQILLALVVMIMTACGGSTDSSSNTASAGGSAQASLPTMLAATRVAYFAPTPAGTSGRVLTVGVGKQYATVCKAVTAAKDGDTIEINSGTYVKDGCYIWQSNLLFKGVGPTRPVIDGANKYIDASGDKGLFVFEGNNNEVENIEFRRAWSYDGNGAGIRLEGHHLKVTNSKFYMNQEGILTNNDYMSDIVIRNTEFATNGGNYGESHNVYIGFSNSLVFEHNWSHDARIGHNLKTRAKTNTIRFNKFSTWRAEEVTAGLNNSPRGNPSYEIDIPSAGSATIVGNIIHQGNRQSNQVVMTYGVEDVTNGIGPVYIGNNTFISDTGTTYWTAIKARKTNPVVMQNNLFIAQNPKYAYVDGLETNSITQYSNFSTSVAAAASVVKDFLGWDLTPAPASPVINAGAAQSDVAKVPTDIYGNPFEPNELRPVDAALDIGAFEAL